jgi:AraC family transcriptional regulator
MSSALSIFEGQFGRVALLDMDRSLVTHAHRSCHALLKFGGADTFFEVGGHLCPLTDDNAVLVNAWEPHAYRHLENAPQTLILALYIDPAWLASLDRQLIFSGHARFFPSPCASIPRKLAMRVREMGARMLMPEGQSKPDAEAAVFDLMIAIISGSSDLRLLRSQRPPAAAGDHRIRRVVAQMRERPGDRLDIPSLAKCAGLSRPHFFAQFKRSTGLSPAVFLNTLRMESAYRMLLRQERMIFDIGHDLGFEAHSNFTRFFREHQGISPSEYRRATQLFY